MTDDYTSKWMFLVEGVDSSGDPVRAVVPALNHNHAKALVREEYQGTITRLRARQITGHQWDEQLAGYGHQYGEPGFRDDFPAQASSIGIRSGRPVFL